MLDELKEAVCAANLRLHHSGLAPETWGNVSGISRERGIVAIKPSGVPYDALTAADIVLVDMDGTVVEGELRPSSDTPTHLVLYRAFSRIGGVTHTHSPAATAFAQADRAIPCYGTTHADYFDGTVPVTRPMTEQEVTGKYEEATGDVIVETFSTHGRDPMRMPGVLVSGHGPFTWGANAAASVTGAIVLEAVAAMARDTLLIRSIGTEHDIPVPEYLLRKHFDRKHGPEAYYGQT